MLHNAGTFRNLVKACDDCRGEGWVNTIGNDYVDDIVLINGAPAWVKVLVDNSPVPANAETATGDNDDEDDGQANRRIA